VKRLPWQGLLYVIVLLLCVLAPFARPTHADGLHREIRSQVTPVPGEPIVLDMQQAQEVAVLVAFIRAYNAGHVDVALTMFRAPWVWSDCDYRRGTVLAGQDKGSLTHWLRQRSADHDQLDIGSIMVGTVQEEALGVTFKRRTVTT